MMQINVLVMAVQTGTSLARVVLNAPEIAPRMSAGRFALADFGSALRAPLFPSRLRTDEFEVLVPLEHPAASLRCGMTVNLIGPIGRGYQVDGASRRLLLVASTTHLPPLLPLVDEGAVPDTHKAPGRRSPASEVQVPERSAALLLFGSSAADIRAVIDLLPSELEVHVANAAESDGAERLTPEFFADLARWADCICIASDPSTYPALAQVVREVRVSPRGGFAQALVVPPMPCGVGACQGCAVRVAGGIKLACTDGPVFDLLELE